MSEASMPHCSKCNRVEYDCVCPEENDDVLDVSGTVAGSIPGEFVIFSGNGADGVASRVEFDGRRFGFGWLGDTGVLLALSLDLAYRARRGEKHAADLLTAFGVIISDADGSPYWPVPPEELERVRATRQHFTDAAQQLARAVQSGDVEAARALADEVFEHAASGGGLTWTTARHFSPPSLPPPTTIP